MTYRELRIALEKISEGEFAEFVKAFCGSYKSPSNEFAHKPKLGALARRAKEQLDKQLQGVV